jgi:hypothetical protein
VNIARGLVTNIEEFYFEPKHSQCLANWTYHITLHDERRFAVSFTDRQLGWLPIVIRWEDYSMDHVMLEIRRGDLGAEGMKRLHRPEFELVP